MSVLKRSTERVSAQPATKNKIDSLFNFPNLKISTNATPTLSSSAIVATRGFKIDMKSMAVYAFTNLWDTFINQHVQGVRSNQYLRPFPIANSGDTDRYVPILIFFMPFNELKALLLSLSSDFSALDSESKIKLVLSEPWRNHTGRHTACNLHFRIAGFNIGWVPPWKLADLLANTVILPAGDHEEGACRIWDQTVENIVFWMKESTHPLKSSSNMTVYRGIKKRPDNFTDMKTLLAQMSTMFTSTSTNPYTACKFSKSSMEGTYPMILRISLPPPKKTSNQSKRRKNESEMVIRRTVIYDDDSADEDLPLAHSFPIDVIDVNHILPREWQCYFEDEIILVPNTFYYIDRKLDDPAVDNCSAPVYGVRATSLTPQNFTRPPLFIPAPPAPAPQYDPPSPQYDPPSPQYEPGSPQFPPHLQPPPPVEPLPLTTPSSHIIFESSPGHLRDT